MKFNGYSHHSAFSPVVKENSRKSFIFIRDKTCYRNTSSNLKASNKITLRLPQVHKSDREDSESTYHSQESPKLKRKLSKEEKRKVSLRSIMKLIISRKADTLQELQQFSDDHQVLWRSPKPISKNSKLSHFRGVSHNGRKWQVMIMGFAKKIYFGGISSEDEASHKYDKYAILMHGLEVRTPFFSFSHQFSIGKDQFWLLKKRVMSNFKLGYRLRLDPEWCT